MSKDFKYIWEGIYSDFSEAPEDDGVFDSAAWLNKQANRIKNMHKDGHAVSMTKAYALAPVLATMTGTGSPTRVLDFGGGLGTEYLSVIVGLGEQHGVDFTIVDNSTICDRGNRLFPDDDDIHFTCNMPDAQSAFDIVHAGSSIQYVDNWKGLLKTFSSYHPKYILLSEVLAGDNPSFVTVQQWHGKGIVTRFLNMAELRSYMEELHYELVLCQSYIQNSTGNGKPLPMDNFPQEYRVDYTRNLTFKRL